MNDGSERDLVAQAYLVPVTEALPAGVEVEVLVQVVAADPGTVEAVSVVPGLFVVGGRRPRSALTGARADPRGLLRRGRVVVECSDGSTVAVVARPRHGAVLVAALNRSDGPVTTTR